MFLPKTSALHSSLLLHKDTIAEEIEEHVKCQTKGEKYFVNQFVPDLTVIHHIRFQFLGLVCLQCLMSKTGPQGFSSVDIMRSSL